jgi:hypothetical protein
MRKEQRREHLLRCRVLLYDLKIKKIKLRLLQKKLEDEAL